MFRFFSNNKISQYFILSLETLKHIKVVRVEKKEFIIIFEKQFYLCKLEQNKAFIIKKIQVNHEFNKPVILAVSIINLKRFEWLIQKATELGVTLFIPMFSQNVAIKLGDEKNITQKLIRWNKIASLAAAQYFRNIVMKIDYPRQFKNVIKCNIVKHKYLSYVKHKATPPITFPQDSLFLIGPEGGFSQLEISLAFKNDFKIISLGKRVLRVETAALFIISRIN